jgi:hypothetical protein
VLPSQRINPLAISRKYVLDNPLEHLLERFVPPVNKMEEVTV